MPDGLQFGDHLQREVLTVDDVEQYELAEAGYEAWSNAFLSAEQPDWNDLPAETRRAWKAAATAIMDAADLLERGR